MSASLTEAIAPSGCPEPAMMLEYYQLGQMTFSSQRFYGVSGNRDYGMAATSGFPVRSISLGPGSTEPVETEVIAIDAEAVTADLFTVPDSLERVSSIGEVF